MKLLTCAIFAACLLCQGGVAHAALQKVSFSGTVEHRASELAGRFAVGQTLNGIFNFDDATPDGQPSLGQYGQYFGAVYAFIGGSNGYFFYIPAGGAGNIEVRDDFLGPGSFDSWSATVPVTGNAVGQLVLESFSISLIDEDASVFVNDALPAALSMGEFENRRFTLRYRHDGNDYTVEGTLSSVAITPLVPEPACGVALAAAVWPVMRRRRMAT